jgi:hypothetical protein
LPFLEDFVPNACCQALLAAAGAAALAVAVRIAHLADGDAPGVRALLEVLPAELARVLGLEDVAQRRGVMVVDQFQGAAGLEARERREDERVALLAGECANVDAGGGWRLGSRTGPFGIG